MRRRFDPREHQKAVDARNALAVSTAESFLKVHRHIGLWIFHCMIYVVSPCFLYHVVQLPVFLRAVPVSLRTVPASSVLLQFAVWLSLDPSLQQDFTLGDINPAAPDFNQGNGPAAEEEAAASGAADEPAAASPPAQASSNGNPRTCMRVEHPWCNCCFVFIHIQRAACLHLECAPCYCLIRPLLL